MFSMKPRPPTVAHVCDDIACRVNGAEALCRDLESRIGKAGEATPDGRATWLRSPCLGQCERAPAVLFQRAGVRSRGRRGRRGRLTADARSSRTLRSRRRAARRRPEPAATRGDPRLRRRRRRSALLRRVGVANPESLDDYRAHGGYDSARPRVRARARRRRRARSPIRAWSAAAARCFRPAASGTRSRGPPRVRTTWSATPTSRSQARSRIAC